MAHRIHKLYVESKEKGKLNDFPTVVSIFRSSTRINQESILVDLTRRLVAKHKPKRIFFAQFWIIYLCNVFQKLTK